MNITEWTKQATIRLKEAGIPTHRLDTLVLLEDATLKDRSWLLAHPETILTNEQVDKLSKLISRREQHEPLAYIRGMSEFYGHEFLVTPDTLQPRSETETMLDLLKQLQLKYKNLGIADIGTGSGCIAISVKLEWPDAKVYATEINKDALVVAKSNATALKVDIQFYKGDLLSPLHAAKIHPGVLLCNLPYVPDSHTINEAAMQEPKVAIFGGKDGLELYRQLFAQAEDFKIRPQYILTESLPFQHKDLAAIAKVHGYALNQTDDFIQLFAATD